MLICEMKTAEAEKAIREAAKIEFPDKFITCVFEHGQWWVMFYDEDEETNRTFSVCDAEGVGIKAGFDFEEV